MSKSLVKKSLKILEGDSRTTKDATEGKPNKKRKSESTNMIPDNKQLVKYVGKKGKKKARYELQTTTPLTMVEAKKRLASKKDRTEENIQKLLRLSKSNLDETSANKLFSKASKGQYSFQTSTTTEKESAFTEEDFKKFEDEYFCS